MGNLNEIFREDVPCDNIKSHKKPGFHPLCRRYIFQKTTGSYLEPSGTSTMELLFLRKYLATFSR